MIHLVSLLVPIFVDPVPNVVRDLEAENERIRGTRRAGDEITRDSMMPRRF